MLNPASTLGKLLSTLPQTGTVTWIGVRPARRVEPIVLEQVSANPETGLEGDHYSSKTSNKRQVTLINEEHVTAIASMLGQQTLTPALLRRNIVVRGINLLALKDRKFQIGSVVLEGTGECHPCSRMEENLGPGGYNAVRGHGGITARVVQEGVIQVGGGVRAIAHL